MSSYIWVSSIWPKKLGLEYYIYMYKLEVEPKEVYYIKRKQISHHYEEQMFNQMEWTACKCSKCLYTQVYNYYL